MSLHRGANFGRVVRGQRCTTDFQSVEKTDGLERAAEIN